MRELIRWIALILAFAASTVVLGWWAVPAVGAIWGLIWNRRGAWVAAAAAAAIAWGLLLAAALVDALGILVSQLNGALRLPALAVAILTVALPALLAGSAAELAYVIRAVVSARRRAAEAGVEGGGDSA
jgi:hypothetical protein